jgi:hypothetical protein
MRELITVIGEFAGSRRSRLGHDDAQRAAATVSGHEPRCRMF